MQRRRFLALLFSFSASGMSALGCSKSPEALCDHYVELRAREGLPADTGVRSTCVDRFARLQARSPGAWKCTVGCIPKRTTVADLDSCPWSCERDYATGAFAPTPQSDAEARRQWGDGIAGDKAAVAAGRARAAVDEAAAEQAGSEMRILNACMTECNGKGLPTLKDKQRCVADCKARNGPTK